MDSIYDEITQIINDVKKDMDADLVIARSIVKFVLKHYDDLKNGQTAMFRLGTYRDMGHINQRWIDGCAQHQKKLEERGYHVKVVRIQSIPSFIISLK